MTDKAEIFNLRKDMNYMKHQLSCIMNALKITQCVCHDCIVTPNLIGTSNEIIVDPLEDRLVVQSVSPPPPKVKTPPTSKHEDCGPKLDQQNVNLFDDILKINVLNTISCSSPDGSGSNAASHNSSEHNYVCASNEHNYGKAKPTDPTAQCVPTNIVTLKDVPKSLSFVKASTPRIASPRKKVKQEENSSLVEDKTAKQDTNPKLLPKRRGRKRKINLNVDPTGSPVKLDKIGRRFYSDEQKKAIYDTYLIKGLHGTAKDFGTSITAIYNQVHRYKDKYYVEEAKLSHAKRLRNTSIAKATENVRLQRRRRPTIKVEESQEILDTPQGDEKFIHAPKRSKKMKYIRGRRIYSQEMKKHMFNYYFTYGRNATMKHFNMTPGIFTYLMYNKCHYQLRQSVKSALKKSEALKENGQNGVENGTDEKNVIKNANATPKTEKINGSSTTNGIVVTDKTERNAATNEIKLLTPKKEEQVETDHEDSVNYETENSIAESVDGQLSSSFKGRRGGRQKILTDEQEQQLYQVLSTLEQQGTRITPNLLAYAAKQIIKRSAEVDPNTIKISYSYAIVSLKKYREQKQ